MYASHQQVLVDDLWCTKCKWSLTNPFFLDYLHSYHDSCVFWNPTTSLIPKGQSLLHSSWAPSTKPKRLQVDEWEWLEEMKTAIWDICERMKKRNTNSDSFSSPGLFRIRSGILEQGLPILALLSVPLMQLPMTKRSPPDQLVNLLEIKLLAARQVVGDGEMESVILHPGWRAALCRRRIKSLQ